MRASPHCHACGGPTTSASQSSRVCAESDHSVASSRPVLPRTTNETQGSCDTAIRAYATASACTRGRPSTAAPPDRQQLVRRGAGAGAPLASLRRRALRHPQLLDQLRVVGDAQPLLALVDERGEEGAALLLLELRAQRVLLLRELRRVEAGLRADLVEH